MQKGENREFVIPIKGLSLGKHEYDFSIDLSFFEDFDNQRFSSAEVDVFALLEKSSTWIKVSCDITGRVGVECDRCLEEVEVELDATASLIVKFVRSEDEEDSDEVMILEPGEAELSLKQFFYDYICLAVPLQNTHEDGECDPEMIKRLKETTERTEISQESSAFGKLKDLLN